MRISRRFALVSAVLAIAASVSAYADAPKYDYLDVAYEGINDPSGSGFSSDHAYGVFGSYAFTPDWLVGAGYAHESADFNILGVSGTASANEYSLDLGYRYALSSNVDLVPSLGYESVSSSASAGGVSASSTDTGYEVGIGLRAMVTDALELNAGVSHSTPVASSNNVGVGALYNFTPAFAVGLGFAQSTSNGQSSSAWTLTGRWYFN